MTTTDADQLRLVRKAVRARNLTDPLGSMGFRDASGRVRRETRVRRIAAALTGACFLGVLGTVLVTGNGGASLVDGATGQYESAASAESALAAIQIISGDYSGAFSSNGIQVTQPQGSTHVQTRGS